MTESTRSHPKNEGTVESPHALAAALAHAAAAINESRTLEETLDAIVETARRSVTAFDQIGVTLLHPDGSLETKSGNGQLVWELDAVQYDLREGPCVEAIEQQSVVVVEDAGGERRWPRYMSVALTMGLRSQLGLRLAADGRVIGSLNLYSTGSRKVSAGWVETARLFALHAAIAIGRAQTEQQLNDALFSRKAIGQATGILMERYQIDEDRAFQFLMRAASTGRIKLVDVAHELVTTADEGYRLPSQQ